MNEILAKINSWIHRKEAEKFTVDGDGNTAVRVIGKVELDTIDTAGQITKVILNETTWTALNRSGTTVPTGTGPLPNRDTFTLQNRTKKDIILQFDSANVDDSVAIILKAGNERFYDVKSTVTLYAKSLNGSGEVILEELS